MTYRVLGPLQVLRDDHLLDLGAPKQRAVLAALLLRRGRVVSTDALIDAVWGDDPPPAAQASLQAYVSNLRRVLRAGGTAAPIVRQAPGYLLDVPAEQVDLERFTALADEAAGAATAGEWAAAAQAAQQGLSLVRGPLLADLADEPWVREPARAFDARRAACREVLATALLGCDRAAEAVVQATHLLDEEPFAERACWLHVLALHRAGRTAEALDAYRAFARRLDEELGLDPGPDLRELQSAVLRQDQALLRWPLSDATGPAASSAETERSERSAGVPIIGRARELATIDRMLDAVRLGGTRWLVLTGPAGIGKTRLAAETAARLPTDVWARCPEEESAPGWWPMRQLLRALGEAPDAVLVPPADVDADAARFAVYERLLAVFEAMDGPIAVVVDDVQWSDPQSTRFLTYLTTALRGRPVAVVLTVRDGKGGEATEQLLAAVARTDGACRLAVGPLADDAVAVLAGQVAATPVDPGEARLLTDRTGGNPLFVCEYARLPRSEWTGIPGAVGSVLGRRLASLDPAVLQALRAAAVLGDVVDLELLRAVTRLDFDDLADLLDEAADEHILTTDPDTGGYRFAHALLREQVLAGLSVPRRQRLHARAAETFAGAETADRVARRAYHLLAAMPLTDAADVLDGCRAAAADAERGFDAERAAQWWGQSLVAFDALPPGARTADERDDLLVARVQALARAGRTQTVLDTVHAALLDALRQGRTASVGRLAAALLRTAGAWPWVFPGTDAGPLLARLAGIEHLVADDPPAHARVLAALAVGSYYEVDPAVPERLSARALELAEATGDRDVLADALLGRVLSFIAIPDHALEATELLGRLLELPHAQGPVDSVLAFAMLTMTRLSVGDIEGATRALSRGVTGADLLRLPIARAQLRWVDATLTQWHGDLDAAERKFAMAAEIHRSTQLYELGITDWARLAIAWDRGVLEEFRQLHDDGGDEVATWAQAALRLVAGDPCADATLTALFDHPPRVIWTSVGHMTLLAHVVADRGAVTHAGRLAEALRPYADRIANVGQIGVFGPVGLSLARLHALLGEHGLARGHLDVAERLSRDGGGTRFVERCRQVRAELAGH